MGPNEALDLKPAVNARLEEAIRLHQQGQLSAAEAIYLQILRQQPQEANALHLLGVVALQTNRLERAVELIQAALRLNPNLATAHADLGVTFLNLNRLEDALASIDRGIALNGASASAHSNRGKVLLDLNRPNEALESFEKAVAIYPNFTLAHSNRGKALLELERWEEAVSACELALKLDPKFSYAWINLACGLNQLERWEEAVNACRRAVELEPRNPEIWYPLGYALTSLGRWVEAERALRMAVQLKPQDPDNWLNLSRALSGLNRRPEAVEAMRRANLIRGSGRAKRDFSGIHKGLEQLVHRLTAPGPFNLREADIRATHEVIMEGLLPTAGAYRKRAVIMGASHRVLPNWADVPRMVERMCEHINTNWSTQHPKELAAFALWYLAWQQPFLDGNKRTSRVVCCSMLLAAGAATREQIDYLLTAVVDNPADYTEYTRCHDEGEQVYTRTKDAVAATQPLKAWLTAILDRPANAMDLALQEPAAHRGATARTDQRGS